MVADTAASKSTLVMRDIDNSVNFGQVNSTANNNSGATFNPAANYTATTSLDGLETNITVDGAGGAFTLTLPAVVGASGQTLFIARKFTAGVVTISGNGGELIVSNGASAGTFALAAKGQAVSLFCDGVQWYATSSTRGSVETLIADPGNAGAIPVAGSGYCPIVTAGSETRTLAAPAFVGQEIMLYIKTDGGSCAVTSAVAINQASNTIMTMNEVRDFIRLVCIENGAAKVWQVVANDGTALS
jgi:hypothetical protein